MPVMARKPMLGVESVGANPETIVETVGLTEAGAVIVKLSAKELSIDTNCPASPAEDTVYFVNPC